MVSKKALREMYEKKCIELELENSMRLDRLNDAHDGNLQSIYESYVQYYSEQIAYGKEIGFYEFNTEIYYLIIKQLSYYQKKLEKELSRNKSKEKRRIYLEQKIELIERQLHSQSDNSNIKLNLVQIDNQDETVNQLSLGNKNSKNNNSIKTIHSYFDDFIGLEPVKNEVEKMVAFLQVQKLRQDSGIVVKNKPSRHMVFTGNPGTGKTEMARLVAKIFFDKKIIPKDIFIEADRASLVGGYLGQTAIKTTELIESALGGVLFIDGAYSIKSENDDMYGDEAIATLLKMMEDKRDDLVVIVAGYKLEMDNFLTSNPGFKSRFNRHIDFPNYSAKELFQILVKMINVNRYEIEDLEALRDTLLPNFEAILELNDPTFANARYVRNYFERVIEKQSLRVLREGVSFINQLKTEDFSS